MPKISEFYFRAAIIFLIIGIGLGLYMSISGNHAVIGDVGDRQGCRKVPDQVPGSSVLALRGAYHSAKPEPVVETRQVPCGCPVLQRSHLSMRARRARGSGAGRDVSI